MPIKVRLHNTYITSNEDWNKADEDPLTKCGEITVSKCDIASYPIPQPDKAARTCGQLAIYSCFYFSPICTAVSFFLYSEAYL